MATHGSAARMLAGGYHLSAFLSDFAATAAVDTNDITTYVDPDTGAAAAKKRYLPGLASGGITGGGIFTFDSTGLTQDQIDDILAASLHTADGVKAWITYLPLGDSFGNIGLGVEAVTTKYEITSPVNDVVKVSLAADSCVGRERVTVLHALAQETASGNGVDLDAGGSYDPTAWKGAFFSVHVTDLAGAGTKTAEIKLQHSADGSTWANLIVPTAFNIDNGKHQGGRYQVVGAASSVYEHLRVVRTLDAGLTSVTFHAAAGRIPV